MNSVKNRAERAIFLAAGFGSRLLPITATTPKPLVKVNGVRIIDTMIDACLAADISEIYIVRGYLKEHFDCLLDKYPMIHFLDNPVYATTNNISSAFIARRLLENAYIFEADLFLCNPGLIRKYHLSSDVIGIPVESTEDWCLLADEQGNVASEQLGGCQSPGKRNCYQMVGIYYFTAADGKRLKNHLKRTYAVVPDGKQRYWETVPNQVFQGSYKIRILPCAPADIVEIDTFDELKAVDRSYL